MLAKGQMATPTFDADFFELPDGTVTVLVRSHWPSADDLIEILGRSTRREPKRVDEFLREVDRNCGGDR